MRVLIVDCHSVIFAWPDLLKLHQRRMILAREELIKLLTLYQDASGTKVIAVFDGRGSKHSREDLPGGIQIFYSATDQTADAVIERLVAKYATEHQITVATSDLLEQQTITSFGGFALSCDGLRDLLADAQADLSRTIKRHRKR